MKLRLLLLVWALTTACATGHLARSGASEPIALAQSASTTQPSPVSVPPHVQAIVEAADRSESDRFGLVFEKPRE